MKPSLLIFCSLLLICVFADTETICDQDSDCNWIDTQNTRYCAKASGACQTRQLFALQKKLGDNTQGCENSLNINGNCGAMAAAGCSIPTQNATFIRCAPGYSLDVNRVCQANTLPTTPVYSKLNQRCTPNGATPEVCYGNLLCVNRVCRKKLTLGQNCQQSQIPCLTGSICEFDECMLPYTKSSGQNCQSSTACASGRCVGNRCVSSSDVVCYSNSDCDANFSCEKRDQLTGQGVCQSNSYRIVHEYQSCLYHGCNQDFNQNPATVCPTGKGCVREYVNQVCDQYCPKRPDQRYNDALGSYTYNCLDLTMTAMKEKECEIRQIIKCSGMMIHLSILSIIAMILLF